MKHYIFLLLLMLSFSIDTAFAGQTGGEFGAVGLFGVLAFGMIIETIAGGVTAPDTTFTALTMLDRDSKTIRNYNSGVARLLDVVSFSQGTGRFRIASPNMHDPTNGIRFQHTSADPSPLLPQGRYFQTFNKQEILTLESTGSATGGDIETHALTIMYDDVDGLNGRYIDEATLAMATAELVGVQVDLTAATTLAYGTAKAINGTVDNFIANRAYAVLGIETTVSQCVVTFQGAETGNVRIGCPGHATKKELTRDYFVQMSRTSGFPCIPVFNSANKANFLLQTVNNENAASPIVTVFLALLDERLFPQ